MELGKEREILNRRLKSGEIMWIKKRHGWVWELGKTTGEGTGVEIEKCTGEVTGVEIGKCTGEVTGVEIGKCTGEVTGTGYCLPVLS